MKESYLQSKADVLAQLNVTDDGLTSEQAKQKTFFRKERKRVR